jgi:arylsulfatase A-like enzyme
MCGTQVTEGVQGHPNVLVFLTDQQRWDTAGLHGNPLGLTPNYDLLATRGTHVPYAFTPQPLCAPARSVLQTGQYATNSGVFRNDICLPRDIPTLAKQFGASGYATGYIGKWHLAATRGEPVPPANRGGYEYWLAADAVELMSDAYDARLYDSDGNVVSLPGYRADAYVDAAIRFLAAAERDRPFFLFVSLLEPHHQNGRDEYVAPTGYGAHYDNRWTPGDLAALSGPVARHLPGYWGSMKRVDEAFGRLLDALESLRLSDSTVVAYTTDHGCHFRTRNKEYKRSAHDASIRIPLALDGPGFRGQGIIDRMVSLIDLPPTLLKAANVSVPRQMQGRSIMETPNSEAGARPDEVFIQISESQVGRALRTRQWKYAAIAPDADPHGDASASRYVDSLLFDLDADPHELTNLIGRAGSEQTVSFLRERLVWNMSAAGEQPAVIEPHPAYEARLTQPERGTAV